MKYAYLFPGQGVQTKGMGITLFENFPSVSKLIELSSDITLIDIKKLLFETDDEILTITENAQIAMTVVNLASAYALKEQGIEPSVVAGFSLGEYSAMVISEVISIEDVFDLVIVRGRIMEAESRNIERNNNQEGRVGMTAVLGMAPQQIQSLLTEWNIPNVYLSMYNSPVQGVLAGTEVGREEASKRLLEQGAKRAIPLSVSGPFHTPLMEEARRRFDEETKHIEFHDPTIPLFSNVHGKQVHTGKEMRELCMQQLVSPVQWVEEEQSVWGYKCEQVFEVGVGNVLTGLWKAWKKTQEDETIPNCKTMGTFEEIKNLEV